MIEYRDNREPDGTRRVEAHVGRLDPDDDRRITAAKALAATALATPIGWSVWVDALSLSARLAILGVIAYLLINYLGRGFRRG